MPDPIRDFIAASRARCEAKPTHSPYCICVKCEDARTDLPRALEALETFDSRTDMIATAYPECARAIRLLRADIARILEGER